MALAWERQERESGRKKLLGEADGILDTVEELRLADQRAVPPNLAGAIEALQLRLGRRATSPATLAAAHRLVLALEGRLMGANPRVAATRVHTDRPAGQPLVRVLQGGLKWKLLTLPAPPTTGPSHAWLELVDATVERACERWMYAQERARRAARDRRDVPASLGRARMAWTNYWELLLEAEDLRRRVGSRPARP